MLISKRKFKAVIFEGGSFETVTVKLSDLTKEDDGQGTEYEYIYALQEEGDKLLDLKVGEAMYFQPNRDNDLAKGIIYRVS